MPITKKCVICGKDFISKPYLVNKITCSRKCWATTKGKPKVKHTCLNCGKEFYDWESNKRKNCSKECSSYTLFSKDDKAHLGFKHTKETKNKCGQSMKGKRPWNYGNRISKIREMEIKRNYVIRNIEKVRISRKAAKIRRRGYGEALKETIQKVYEDNIKKYGTLTCYLCLKPILFGNDHLEHKTPLSKGGSNDYSNLEVACCSCNLRKNKKTEKEFKEFIAGVR